MYNYQDFAKAVYDELQPGESFAEWDDHTFYSSEPPPPEMTFCERWFKPGDSANPYVLAGVSYVLLQLSCTNNVWEIFTSDQVDITSVPFTSEAAAREAWALLLA